MRRARERGFTLMEVLVAFTVAAVLLAVLLRSFGLGVERRTQSAATAEAALLARSGLELLAASLPLAEAEHAGELAPGYAYAASITRAVDIEDPDLPEDALLALWRIELSVAWREGGRARRLDLATLVAAPAPAP